MAARARWRRGRSSRQPRGDTSVTSPQRTQGTHRPFSLEKTILCVLCVIAGAVNSLIAQRPQSNIYGFTARSAAAERSVERRFLALPSPEQARKAHAFLTAEPHVAGTPR